MPLLARLVSTFPFLRFYMSFSNISHLKFLFPNHSQSLEADSWATTIKTIDHDKDVCYVSRIEYYKCIKGKEHEFLVASINHTPSGHTATVLMDRSPECVSTNGNQVEHASRKASSKVPAHDQIRVQGTKAVNDVTHDFKPIILLATLTFTRPPSLLEFGLLLDVVHNHAPQYDVVYHQCYWYCDTTFRTLQNMKYEPNKVETKHWSKRGKYGPVWVGQDSLEAIEQEHAQAIDEALKEAQVRKEEAQAHDKMVRANQFLFSSRTHCYLILAS